MTILFGLIGLLCNLFSLAIFIRVILSWFALNPYNPVMSILIHITEPILAPLRRIVPRAGMFDFSPLLAIVLLQIIASLLP